MSLIYDFVDMFLRYVHNATTPKELIEPWALNLNRLKSIIDRLL